VNVIAYQIAKAFAWLLPLSFVIVGGLALAKDYRWAGASFLCSGLSGLAWDFLFMPAVFTGIRPFFPDITAFEDAPLGFVLANILPLVSGVTLITGCFLLLYKENA
jgi:hypothetical protein